MCFILLTHSDKYLYSKSQYSKIRVILLSFVGEEKSTDGLKKQSPCFFVVLGTELWASHTLGKCSTIALYSLPKKLYFVIENHSWAKKP